MFWLLACTEAPAPAPVVRPRPPRAKRGAPPGMPDEGRYRRRKVLDQELLDALGYADGENPTGRPVGVTIHDAAAVSPGNNLYVSGVGPEAHLIDRDGKVLHHWKRPWKDVFPAHEWKRKAAFPDHWRRALLLEDGSLFVIWGGQGMARLDRDSNVIWSLLEPVHHDLELVDGTLWTLTRRVETWNGQRRILDAILALDAETGTEKYRYDVQTLVENGPFAPLARRYPDDADLFHTNTLEYLTGPPFAAGQWLVSFRHLDTIGVVDLEREALVWALGGMFGAQHQPTVVGANVLLFDNEGLPGRSRVLEIDPRTQRVVWRYGELPGQAFYSRTLGSVQRLPNGNTLITESNEGHAFEVTPEGTRVWSYTVPHTAGDEDQFIASLYELVRLPPDFAFP